MLAALYDRAARLLHVAHGVVMLDGVIDMVGRQGLGTPLGLPRTVMTVPNMLAPVNMQQPWLWFKLTGDNLAATNAAVVSVDGSAPLRLTLQAGDIRNVDLRNIRPQGNQLAAWFSDGLHTVVTWREDIAGQMVPTSQMTFTYFVGGSSPPPPPPPPPPPTEICGDGLDNDGDGLVDEDFVPPAVSVSLLDPNVPTAVFLDANGCRVVK